MPSYDELLEKGENPIRVIRTEQGLSIRRAAEKIGCHYQTVYMAEHGMCDPLFAVVLLWASANSEYTLPQITDAYDMFLARKRGLAREMYSLEMLPTTAVGIPGTNPIRSLRQYLGLTTSRFCKDLCIPVSLLHNSERADSLPGAMCVALYSLGVDGELIEEIAERYELL